MPRINKTRFALLGLLSTEPMSGYDIKHATERSIGYFWQESYGAIYPNLRTLHKEGLVSRNVEPGEGKPDRHVYTITEKGREELKRWLTESPAPEPYRNELLLKLFNGPCGKRSDMQHHVQVFLRMQRILVKQLEGILQQISKQFEGNPGLPYWSMTLRYGILSRQALIEWAKETLDTLETLEEGPFDINTSLGSTVKEE
jgi:DNA-binding PadR family transcriptional regulator